MYNYNVEFVLEQMVMITSVESKFPLDDDDVIDLAVDKLKSYYKIDILTCKHTHFEMFRLPNSYKATEWTDKFLFFD